MVRSTSWWRRVAADFSDGSTLCVMLRSDRGAVAPRSTHNGSACFETQASPAPQHDDPGCPHLTDPVAEAYRAAAARFATILDELCAELPLLRQPARADDTPLRGGVARRMWAAVAPFARETLVTPMAAVAGAVAGEVLAAMVAAAPPPACGREQRRRHRTSSGIGREPASRPRRPAGPARIVRVDDHPGRRPRARRRDQRLARTQLLARHRGRGHDPRPHGRRGGRRSHDCGQRRRPARSSGDRPPPRPATCNATAISPAGS